MSKRGPYRRHTAASKLQLFADIRGGTITRSEARRQHSLSAKKTPRLKVVSSSETSSIVSGSKPTLPSVGVVK